MTRSNPPPERRADLRERAYRAVVTDVDGTITDRARRLYPPAVHALQTLERRGIPVLLATGNVLPIALALHRFLGLSGPIVAENGGLLFRPERNRGRVDRLADPRPVHRAYRALTQRGIPVHRLFTDRWRETEIALEPSVSVRRVRQALKGRPVTVESTGYAIHLIESGAGKLPALKAALSPLGLSPSDCVVLGDGDNDVEMLRAAGFGVSFPSGSARARRAANYVTRADFAAGFVEGLKAAGMLH